MEFCVVFLLTFHVIAVVLMKLDKGGTLKSSYLNCVMFFLFLFQRYGGTSGYALYIEVVLFVFIGSWFVSDSILRWMPANCLYIVCLMSYELLPLDMKFIISLLLLELVCCKVAAHFRGHWKPD